MPSEPQRSASILPSVAVSVLGAEEVKTVDEPGEYGIVATVTETDRVFRKGARAWIAGGTGGEGWHTFKWIARSRGSNVVEKWAPTMRFTNFRAKWVPMHLRTRVTYIRGTRAEMERVAAEMEAFAAKEREAHPNRGWKP